MNKEKFKFNQHESKLANAERCSLLPDAAKRYTAPDIEVIDIELTHNFLGSGDVPDMDPIYW